MKVRSRTIVATAVVAGALACDPGGGTAESGGGSTGSASTTDASSSGGDESTGMAGSTTSDPSADTTAGPTGGGLPDCSFDPGLAFEPDGEILQLQSADGGTCVRIERRDDGPGTLANTQWTLLDIRVGPLGDVAHVDDPAALCWYSSHHNFTDWAHAWTGGAHYDVKLEEDGHGGSRTYELHAFAQGPLGDGPCAPLADGGEPLGDPIELVPLQP